MADTDPLLALRLAPDERVLWQARPPLGAPWPGAAALFGAAVGCWVVLLGLAAGVIVVATLAAAAGALEPYEAAAFVALALAGSVGGGPAVIAGVVALIAVSKHVGPFYVSIFALGLWGPAFAIFWTSLVASRGWSGAVARLEVEDVVAAAALVGLPLTRLALGVTRRLALVHVITDRRVAELRGARVVWERPRADLRLERSWRSPSGHLVVGVGKTRRTLHVRDADPARLLEDLDAPASLRGADPTALAPPSDESQPDPSA